MLYGAPGGATGRGERTVSFEADVVFDVVDLLGVLTNGILGGVVARQLRMDLVGFTVLAILSGLGGGILRDTLLQQGFPVALTNPAYLTSSLVGAVLAYLMVFGSTWTFRALFLADCLSVGCWDATGTVKALGAGLAWPPAILLGVVTAVGGGMIRDVAVGRLPAIFGGNTLYATSAMIASALMALLAGLGHPTWGMAGAIVVSAVVSISARRFGWRLPGPANLSPSTLRKLRRRPRQGRHAHRR